MSKVVRIDDEMFSRMIECIRHHQDPENLNIEIMNDDGDMIIYDNGDLCFTFGDSYCWIKSHQLCHEQRDMLTSVLVDQVGRIVYNIIEEVCTDVG
jgi:tRNA(His) 5'-end guanylyltransferase